MEKREREKERGGAKPGPHPSLPVCGTPHLRSTCWLRWLKRWLSLCTSASWRSRSGQCSWKRLAIELEHCLATCRFCSTSPRRDFWACSSEAMACQTGKETELLRAWHITRVLGPPAVRGGSGLRAGRRSWPPHLSNLSHVCNVFITINTALKSLLWQTVKGWHVCLLSSSHKALPEPTFFAPRLVMKMRQEDCCRPLFECLSAQISKPASSAAGDSGCTSTQEL